MCGIVGYVGNTGSFDKVFKALQSLEYRGYDSFGFGAIADNEVICVKEVGAVSEASSIDFSKFEECSSIIGHTRWATHGGVTQKNSHPHVSSDGSICIAHNGVIANFEDLLERNPQWDLKSETDTEAAANFIADALKQCDGDLMQSLAESVRGLDGEFGICGLVPARANCMFAIKRKSPLAVCLLPEGVVFSSDRSAFNMFGNKLDVLQLEDDEIFIYEDGHYSIAGQQDGKLTSVERSFEPYTWTDEETGLGHYPHYMIKEIHESPQAVETMVEALQPSLRDIVNEMLVSDNTMTGSGSAYYVTVIGQYLFQAVGGMYVATHPSDEYLNVRSFSKRDLLLTVSQSGETFDTLEVLRQAQDDNATLVAFNNVAGSTMQRMVDFPVYQNSGREVCVLSTKSIISQVTGLYLLALEIGKRTGKLSEQKYASLRGDIEKLPGILKSIITDYNDEIKRVATKHCNIEHWFFIGRGAQYAVAQESALKFKEVSYLHAEGMSAGFFKHGTISLIDNKFYTVVFLPSQVSSPDLYQATLDNVHEIKARDGHVIGIGHGSIKDSARRLFDEFIILPDLNEHLNIMSQLICGQLLAYHCAVALGRNIDKPRALAKSVTVR